MQLKIDEESWFALDRIINAYYEKQARHFASFRSGSSRTSDSLEFCFLIDRKHVVKYIIGSDRGMLLGILFLGIGPAYFGPADFWSYEDSQRFRLGINIEDINHNLGLLDEFLGRESALKRAHGG